jgi:hypothetical protein
LRRKCLLKYVLEGNMEEKRREDEEEDISICLTTLRRRIGIGI